MLCTSGRKLFSLESQLYLLSFSLSACEMGGGQYAPHSPVVRSRGGDAEARVQTVTLLVRQPQLVLRAETLEQGGLGAAGAGAEHTGVVGLRLLPLQNTASKYIYGPVKF